MGDLYETDILDWSEHQAELLRRMATGDRVNAEAADWLNVIEGIAPVDRSRLSAVRSLLHDLKAEVWPRSRDLPHWRAEARGFRRDTARASSPSTRQKIDLAGLYADALVRLPDSMDGEQPLPVPTEWPATLDQLLTIWK